MEIHTPDIPVTLEPAAEMDRLGDEIAELSAHVGQSVLEGACTFPMKLDPRQAAASFTSRTW